MTVEYLLYRCTRRFWANFGPNLGPLEGVQWGYRDHRWKALVLEIPKHTEFLKIGQIFHQKWSIEKNYDFFEILLILVISPKL